MASNVDPVQLKRDFDDEMLKIYTRARDECGYHATRFRQMLVEHRGVETARRLLPTMSDGYAELWRRKRLDLTVEALILREPWRALFSPMEQEVARRVVVARLAHTRRYTVRAARLAGSFCIAPPDRRTRSRRPALESRRLARAVQKAPRSHVVFWCKSADLPGAGKVCGFPREVEFLRRLSCAMRQLRPRCVRVHSGEAGGHNQRTATPP